MTTALTDEQKAKRAKLFGLCLIPASLVIAYFWILRPILEARQTGALEYNIKGILMPPAFLYMGIALLVTDLRDGQFRQTDLPGGPRLTKKGILFIVGLVIVMMATYALWTAYLHAQGFKPA